ncbi:MAG: STAS domain-containing protein, partial [Planctomycetota bacterium]
FDTYYCPMLMQEVDSLVSAGSQRVVLNMRLVRFINSTALGAIIKASKTLKAADGDLAISRPSPFVRDILEKVGLNKVVPVFDSDEAAGASIAPDQGEAAVDDDAALDLDDGGSIIFTLLDAERLQHFVSQAGKAVKNPVHGHDFGSNWRGIGRMSAVDSETLSFTWGGGSTGLTPFEMGQLLALGTELNVKFRLPLLKKGHVEAGVVVTEIEERPEGVKVAAEFAKQVDDETLQAIRQYASDIAYLKKELPKRGE